MTQRDVRGYAVALLLFLSGCASRGQVVNVTAPSGQKASVKMKASNFAFDPDVIVAQKGDTLVLIVTNVSGEEHNLTVKDPSESIIQSENIPAHQTITMEVPLQAAGVYPFYCDKPFHTTLGMKGRIEVK